MATKNKAKSKKTIKVRIAKKGECDCKCGGCDCEKAAETAEAKCPEAVPSPCCGDETHKLVGEKMSPSDCAKVLKEYQLWRKGKGRYGTLASPSPMSPHQLTITEEAAIAHLEAYQPAWEKAQKKAAKGKAKNAKPAAKKGASRK